MKYFDKPKPPIVLGDNKNLVNGMWSEGRNLYLNVRSLLAEKQMKIDLLLRRISEEGVSYGLRIENISLKNTLGRSIRELEKILDLEEE